jgi:hypothetical protein
VVGIVFVTLTLVLMSLACLHCRKKSARKHGYENI